MNHYSTIAACQNGVTADVAADWCPPPFKESPFALLSPWIVQSRETLLGLAHTQKRLDWMAKKNRYKTPEIGEN